MIPKSQLIEMFETIAKETDWDMSGEMVWSYFFTDDSREKLENLAERLVDMGYQTVEIMDGDDTDDPLMLEVEKIEVHSPDTLEIRNRELCDLAVKSGIGSYDGMDVGPIGGDDDEEEFDGDIHE